MAKKTVEVLIEGGKATAAPPLGPALGPLGVNIGQVVAEINKKTAEFKKMQVPVKVIVDEDTKEFEITVGTPPTSELIKKEAHIEKGSGTPNTGKIADVRIEQIIKIAKMKADATLGVDLFSKVKEVIGTCDSMGVMVEGMDARDAIAKINEGMFKEKIATGKTELSAEALKELEEKRKKLQEELDRKKAEFTAKAKEIIDKNKNQTRATIKAKLVDARIPAQIIEELLPAEAAGGAAKPAAGGAKAGEKKK
ncbi:MAG TPA: 50S ribosomal protein L11 [Candidatus Woesearchaeota archaeon]|nr:MAG: 50S ribosomal protein L11 [Candidatus Woesearchaeota archaeon]HDD70691.1 50S ribosomal protein L11 [Candidatus Woesearchaeota archaeon]